MRERVANEPLPKAPRPSSEDELKAQSRGRAASEPLPQAPRRPSEDEQKAPWRTAVANEPLPKAPRRLGEEEPKASWRIRVTNEPSQQTPRRPSEAFAKPLQNGESKPKTQLLTHTLTQDVDALRRKLQGAARDIVQVMDSELPRDLERRFTSGEGDVYIRHLLENRVARLPGILGRRYKAEREVRSRVDTYIRLFERMLDTFAEAPQGDRLVDTSLASESGKLYLLLAQASGRISPQ